MTVNSNQLGIDGAHQVSFIVPAYNEQAELPATLASIQKAAENVGCDYEIILVDDGSTDATPDIGRQFGIEVVTIQRRQIAAARNAGARRARGDVLVFVDADTRISQEHVRGVLEALNRGAAGGGARLGVDREIPRWGKILFHGFATIYFGLRLGAGAFLFTTRENFLVIGGFDETYFASEEVFFTLALKKLGPFKILPYPAVTSGRKLRLYSGWQIFTGLLGLLVGGRRAVMSRTKLQLWYGGERERRISG
jgi:Glycosyltransferases involved in cell wall biogenesis